MSRLPHLRLIVPALLVVALAAVLATSAVAAPKPQTVSSSVVIPAGWFTPEGNVQYDKNIGLETLEAPGSSALYDAPLVLPDRAEITKMTVFFVDTQTENILINLDGYSLNTQDLEVLAIGLTSGAQAGIRTLEVPVTSANRIVDNGTFGYFVRASVPVQTSALSLRAVKIEYNIPR